MIEEILIDERVKATPPEKPLPKQPKPEQNKSDMWILVVLLILVVVGFFIINYINNKDGKNEAV